MSILPKASLPCLEDLLILGHNAVTLHGSGMGPAGLPGRGKKKVLPLLRGNGENRRKKGQYATEVVARFTRGR